MSETEIKLRECPFCGCADIKYHPVIFRKYNDGEDTLYAASCEECFAESMAYQGKEGAAKAWNRRSSPIKPLEASGEEKLLSTPWRDMYNELSDRNYEKIQSLYVEIEELKQYYVEPKVLEEYRLAEKEVESLQKKLEVANEAIKQISSLAQTHDHRSEAMTRACISGVCMNVGLSLKSVEEKQ